jgi:hypothetical protein
VSRAESEAERFAAFKSSISRVQVRTPLAETPEHERIRAAAAALIALPAVDLETVAVALTATSGGVSSDALRALGLAVGLSHERLRSELNAHLDADQRRRPEQVVAFLDREFSLLTELRRARARDYTWADVLVARAGARQSAGQAIAGGRSVEDAIESVVRELRLPYEARTQFVGRNATAPCDVAIPEGGKQAAIVCAAKGFDSTGSKLTDAAREIEEMASVRLPTQFVFVIIDGLGWHRRQGDLRRIFRLLESRSIDGLYSLSLLPRFRDDLDAAATRLRIRRR